MNHPLKIGDYIETLVGERHAPPGSVGKVISVDHYPGQGWTYGVHFNDSGVWVFIDQQDSIHDPAKYRYLGPACSSTRRSDCVKMRWGRSEFRP